MAKGPTTAQILTEALRRLEGCLEDNDRATAVQVILDAVNGGLSIEDLYAGVLEPFLESVGRRWQEGRTAVWQEHLIVGAVRTAIESLYPRVLQRKAEVAALPLTVAFFCPPEETHDVGLRMLVDRFDLKGFRTVYVGAMTPVDQMIDCVRSTQADVICLSASTHYQRTALREIVARLQKRLPGVRIVVGGPAFAHSDGGWEDHAVTSVDSFLDELAALALSDRRETDATASAEDTGGPSKAQTDEDPPDA